MPKFIITYLGGDHPSSPEDRQAHMQAYMGWIKGLGDAAISPMNPMGTSSFVTSGGVTEDWAHPKMSGYTVVEADDKDAAIAMAKDCPFLDIGGTLEVAQLMQMNK